MRIFLVALAFVTAFWAGEAASQSCPGSLMSPEWTECRKAVLNACAFVSASQSGTCEAAALQRFVLEQRAAKQNFVSVKYRQTPVDVAHPRFEYLDTSRSSFVTGAWYDSANSYMVIGLRGTHYHYCRMPMNAWTAFRRADSFGKHYNAFIKAGNYDCRLGGVPAY